MEGRRDGKYTTPQLLQQEQPEAAAFSLASSSLPPENQPNSTMENFQVSGQYYIHQHPNSTLAWNTQVLAPANHHSQNPNFQDHFLQSPGLQNLASPVLQKQATTQSHFFQSPGMQNLATTQSHFLQKPGMQNLATAQSHFLQNPGMQNLATEQSHFLQNPGMQNQATMQSHLLQSPGLQNLATTQTFPTDHRDYPMNQRYYSIWSTDPRGHHNAFQGRSYNVLSRVNRSTPSHDGYNYSILSSPYENNNQVDMDEQIRQLQRLKLDYPNQVRQQASVYTRANTNSVPFIINEDHSANYFPNFANQQYGNIQNRARNLAAAATANISNFSQHETRLGDEDNLGYSSARRTGSTRNRAIRLDLGSQCNGGRSVTNGFHHPVNSSKFPSSSLYNNNNVGRARQRVTSVEELRGRLCFAAKDQHRSRFLQEKVEERNPQIIEMIFMEVKDEWYELMVHQFGNHLIQKLLRALNQEQMTQFILWIAGSEKVFKLCEDEHGTRVMQHLMGLGKTLTPEQTSILVSALRNITVKLSKSSNGYRVMLRCFEIFSNEYTKDLVEQMAENCLSLATDKNGCCVLPQCIIHAQKEHKGRLIADVVTNALVLAEHPFGNYVLQGVLLMNIPQVTADIVSQLAGSYFTLSQSIFASNVVEKCMRESGVEQSTAIVNEIINHPDVLHLMLDRYGNFVIQSAWKVSEGRPVQQQAIFRLVHMNFPLLQSHMYGSKVLKTVRASRYVNKHM